MPAPFEKQLRQLSVVGAGRPSRTPGGKADHPTPATPANGGRGRGLRRRSSSSSSTYIIDAYSNGGRRALQRARRDSCAACPWCMRPGSGNTYGLQLYKIHRWPPLRMCHLAPRASRRTWQWRGDTRRRDAGCLSTSPGPSPQPGRRECGGRRQVPVPVPGCSVVGVLMPTGRATGARRGD